MAGVPCGRFSNRIDVSQLANNFAKLERAMKNLNHFSLHAPFTNIQSQLIVLCHNLAIAFTKSVLNACFFLETHCPVDTKYNSLNPTSNRNSNKYDVWNMYVWSLLTLISHYYILYSIYLRSLILVLSFQITYSRDNVINDIAIQSCIKKVLPDSVHWRTDDEHIYITVTSYWPR